MRRSRVTALVITACAASALVACAAPAAPTETPTSRAETLATRCLADHSPWTVDLDAVYDAWIDAVPETTAARGGEVTGSARLSFTRGDESAWAFTAEGVDFELFTAEGAIESTVVARELAGDYTLVDDGTVLELTTARVLSGATEVTTTAPDGGRSEGVSVPAPGFPWNAAPGTRLAFTCTEHRLVVSVPGGTPATWSLYPS